MSTPKETSDYEAPPILKALRSEIDFARQCLEAAKFDLYAVEVFFENNPHLRPNDWLSVLMTLRRMNAPDQRPKDLLHDLRCAQKCVKDALAFLEGKQKVLE